MNFEMFLVIITSISGVFWLINKFINKAVVNPIVIQNPKQDIISEIIEYIGSLFFILLTVLLFRTFICEGYRIPSGSMKPTLIEGDCVLVNKYKYGLKLPITHKKITKGALIKRGDIVIFWHAKTKKIYIKRVIGLPGDHIKYDQQHHLYINKNLVQTEYLGFTVEDRVKTEISKEDLDQTTHKIYINSGYTREYPFNDLVVTSGHYFVMGDNRTNSSDSRLEGLIPEEVILGKAFFIFFSMDFNNWVIRFERLWQRLI